MKTNRRDLRKLVSIQNMAGLLESKYTALSDETKEFLEEEFTGGTGLKLRDFQQNINDAIRDMKIESAPKRMVSNSVSHS